MFFPETQTGCLELQRLPVTMESTRKKAMLDNSKADILRTDPAPPIR